MKNIRLVLLICMHSVSYSQDSLYIGKVYTLPQLNYSYCKGKDWAEYEFQKEYAHILDSITQFLKSNKKVKYEIRFHTDSRGSDSANLVLSQKKADDWFNILVKRGVDSLSIKPIGFGESNPRIVWVKDTTFYEEKPIDFDATATVLTEEYINSFRKIDKKKFEKLHQLNRREELVIISIE